MRERLVGKGRRTGTHRAPRAGFANDNSGRRPAGRRTLDAGRDGLPPSERLYVAWDLLHHRLNVLPRRRELPTVAVDEELAFVAVEGGSVLRRHGVGAGLEQNAKAVVFEQCVAGIRRRAPVVLVTSIQ